MALRLTESQLAQALNGLNPPERIELLQLLEERERQEADEVIDDRPQWDGGHIYLIPRRPNTSKSTNRGAQEKFEVAVTRSLEAVAARSTDPGRFKIEWARYKPVYDKHFAALSDAAVAEAEARGELTDTEKLFVVHNKFDALCDQAKAMAVADGYEDPHDTFSRPPEPEPVIEPDPLERLKRASLPRATRTDLEETAARRAESEAYRRAAREDATFHRPAPAPATEPSDKLDGFRGIGPVNYPGNDNDW